MTNNSTINSMIDTICKMVENVEEGTESPFEAIAYLKELSTIISASQKQVMEVAIHESRFEDKSFSKGDHIFTKVSGRAIYNFKKLADWKLAKDNLTEIETKYKTAFRNYSNGLTNVTEDGEVLQLPEVKHTSDTISIKLNANKID